MTRQIKTRFYTLADLAAVNGGDERNPLHWHTVMFPGKPIPQIPAQMLRMDVRAYDQLPSQERPQLELRVTDVEWDPNKSA